MEHILSIFFPILNLILIFISIYIVIRFFRYLKSIDNKLSGILKNKNNSSDNT